MHSLLQANDKMIFRRGNKSNTHSRMHMRLFINIKFKWNYHCLCTICSVFNRFTIAICLFSGLEHAYLTQMWHVTCVEHYNYNVEMTAHSTQPPQKLSTIAYFVLHNGNERSRDQCQDQERKVQLCAVCVEHN